MEHTLNEEQIENWRKFIFIQLEKTFKGAGAYALIMPDSEVIEYWKKTKAVLENPENYKKPEQEKVVQTPIKTPCKHTNSFTGGKGKYCIDCEKYVTN